MKTCEKHEKKPDLSLFPVLGSQQESLVRPSEEFSFISTGKV